jgi:outer membrane protein TolC
VGDLLNPVYASLNQLMQTDRFPQISNVDELLAPNNFHDTKFSVQYVLYSPEIQYNHLIQQRLFSAEEARKRVLENELRYAIEVAYFQYAQTLEALQIADNTRLVMEELGRLNQKLVANAVLTKDAVVAAEYELSKLDQQRAEFVKNRDLARAYFNFLLNRPLQQPVQLVNEEAPASLPSGEEGLARLTQQAQVQRGEFEQLGASLRAAEEGVRLQQLSAHRPMLTVGANTGFQGFGYSFAGQAYLIAQFGLTWDLFKGYERRSKMQQARIQVDQLKGRWAELEKQVELQTTQAYYELTASREALRTATVARQKAEQYFGLISSRYRNGTLLLIEYLKAQSEVQTAQHQYTLAVLDHRVKEALLKKVIGHIP